MSEWVDIEAQDDWEDIPVPRTPDTVSTDPGIAPHEPSPLETGLAAMAPKGLVSSVYGLKEAIPVGLEEGFDEGLKAYRRERDQARRDLESSEALNPRSAMVGGIAPYLPLATTGIPAAMAVGGASSAIDSKADLTRLNEPEQLSQFGRDVGSGMALGGVLGGLGKYAPKTTTALAGGALAGELVSPGGGAVPGAALGLAARGVGSPAVRGYLLKKFGNTLLDVPEAVAERYMRDPKKVMSAPSTDVVAQNIANTLGEVKSDIGGLNKAATQVLSGNRAKGVMKVNEAVEILGQFRNPEAKQMADEIMSGYVSRAGSVSPQPGAELMTEIEVHKLKKFLQGLGEWNSPLPSADKAQANFASGQVNRLLKGENPQYAGAMDDLSRAINTKNALASKFGIARDFSDPSTLAFSDRTISAMKDLVRANKYDRARILQDLKDQGYGDIADQIQDSLAKQVLTGGGAPQGSRKAVVGANVGTAIGAGAGAMVGGPVGGAIGGFTGRAVGSGMGALADKYGPRMARRMMSVNDAITKGQSAIGAQVPKIRDAWRSGGTGQGSAYVLMQNKGQSAPVPFKEVARRDEENKRRPQSMNLSPDGVMQKLQKSPNGQKFMNAIQSAKDRGPDSFGATYFLLMNSNQEFRKLMQEGEQ